MSTDILVLHSLHCINFQVGEVVANYGIVLLNVERLFAITCPMRARVYLSLRRNALTLGMHYTLLYLL